RTTTVPSSGASFPARIRNRVVFPTPFTPTSPYFSPSAMPSDTSRNNHASRNDFESRSADKTFTITENRYQKVRREFSGKKAQRIYLASTHSALQLRRPGNTFNIDNTEKQYR